VSTPSSQKVFTKDQTVTRGGLVYHQDTNELVTGIVEEFHENGQLRIRNNFKDGKRDGPWEWFHENGQLRVRGSYIEGELDGLYEWFYNNGQSERRGTYRNGEPDGLWEWFDENGNLTETRTYRNGDLVETNSNPQQVFKPTK